MHNLSPVESLECSTFLRSHITAVAGEVWVAAWAVVDRRSIQAVSECGYSFDSWPQLRPS